jgi:hypothetical protein
VIDVRSEGKQVREGYKEVCIEKGSPVGVCNQESS